MGLSNEVYLVKFPDHLIDCQFNEIVEVLYTQYNALLIGVETLRENGGNKEKVQEVLLNPINYSIKPGDNGFIIASDFEDAQSIIDCDLASLKKNPESSILNSDFGLFKSQSLKKSTKNEFDSQHLLM